MMVNFGIIWNLGIWNKTWKPPHFVFMDNCLFLYKSMDLGVAIIH